MKIWVYTLLISFFISNSLLAKTLEQKKVDLKKAFEAGALTKTEYNKTITNQRRKLCQGKQ